MQSEQNRKQDNASLFLYLYSIAMIGLKIINHCRCPGIMAQGARVASAGRVHRQNVLLLFDVMDTVVHDPFYTRMPLHFGLTFEELLQAKHPDMWVRFERGDISEEYFLEHFFKDKRHVDRAAMVDMLKESYAYVDGMEVLLQRLKSAGYEMRTFSNYPMWYQYIEETLTLSRFLEWTYVSCTGPLQGKRKPDMESFQCVIDHAGERQDGIFFIDDRESNVIAAQAAGLQGIKFSSALQLEADLLRAGLEF